MTTDTNVIDRDAGTVQGLLLSAVSVALIVAISAPVPVIPQMTRAFADQPQITRLITLVAVLPALAVALSSLIAGALADRIGHRRLLTYSAALFAISGLAPLWLNSFVLILASRLITGIAMGMMIVPAVALTGEYYTGRTRQRWLGIQFGATAVAGVLVAVVSGALGELGWRYAFLPLLIGPMLFVGLLVLPEHGLDAGLAETQAEQPFARVPWTAWLLILSLGYITSALVCVPSYEMGALLQEKNLGSSGLTGVFLALVQVGAAVAAFAVGVFGRLSVPARLSIAMASAAVGALFIAQSGTLTPLGAGCLAAGAAQGLLGPLFAAWLMSQTPPALYGRAVGSMQTLSYLAYFTAPLTARQIAVALHSSSGDMRVIGVFDLALTAAAILALLFRTRPPSSISPPLNQAPDSGCGSKRGPTLTRNAVQDAAANRAPSSPNTAST